MKKRDELTGIRPYVAVGRGYFGDYDSPSEARAVVKANGQGAVYIHEKIHAALLRELAAAKRSRK